MFTTEDFRVKKHLNEPRTFMKMEYDEIIPALFVFGMFWLVKAVIFGFFLACVWIFLIKKLKRGKGSGFMWLLIYWYTPEFVHLFFFPHSPSSDIIEWRD
jgi:type IV conjugative transfer system protein TraL